MHYPLEHQEMGLWCWAAVALSVTKYFDPATEMTQCSVASAVKNKKCCADKPGCNQADLLEVALGKVGHFNQVLPRRLSFSELRDVLRAGTPVCVRIGWFGGGGHFVVVTGFTVNEFGEQLVAVADPLYESDTWPYDEFASGYLRAGQWTHTYLVQE